MGALPRVSLRVVGLHPMEPAVILIMNMAPATCVMSRKGSMREDSNSIHPRAPTDVR